MPWIEHPATQDGPVSLWRWLKYHVGIWMIQMGQAWEDEALHPERVYCPECGHRITPGVECDHIPF